ncbi:MAG: PKD domain-containing protein, partial [Solirubrobacterales bacterium]
MKSRGDSTMSIVNTAAKSGKSREVAAKMESGRKIGRFGAIRLVLATMLALLVLPAAAASADQVSNPGSFDMSITGGSLQIGSLPENDILDFGAPTLSGTVDSAGVVAVPSAGVDFPSKYATTIQVSGNPVDVDLSIEPAGDAAGTIDPDAGSLALSLPVKILVEGSGGSPDFGPNCTIGTDLSPIALSLTSGDTAAANPISGTPFNQDDGTGKIVDNNFTIAAVSGCDKIGGVIPVDPAINSEAGLPAAAEASNAKFDYEITSAPVGEIDAAYTTDKTSGSAPLAVSFDASTSKSRIVNYSWDFGDGSPVADTVDPTIVHAYTAFGTYQPELTVTRANSDTDTYQGDEIVVAGAITTFTQEAAALSNEKSPTFEFSSDTPPATYECRVDGGSWSSCTSPRTLNNLPDGAHTFEVRASHFASVGVVASATPFTIDTAKPVVSIDSAPDALIGTGVTEGTVEFSADDPTVDFSCRYDGSGSDPFEPCISPKELTWAAADGDHKFEVKAVDDLGNASDAVDAEWTVDVTAPTTTIDSSPVSPNGFSDDPRAAFTFSANEPGSSFICEFNGGGERPCESGVQAGTGDQGSQDRLGDPVEGTNTFTVWAVDDIGNRDPAGATASYEFIGEQPEISIISGPSGSTTSNTASVVFQSNNQDVTDFECRDTEVGGPWASCTPGVLNPRLGKADLAGLSEGAHNLEIRGVNAIGAESKGSNVASVSWMVDNTPPTVSVASGPEEGSFQNTDSATFGFASSEEDVTYSCRLDGAGSWSSCDNPAEFTGLSDSSHTLRVRATDAAGNVSNDPAVRNWNVGQPGVTLTSTPVAISPTATGTFEFSGAGPFECRLDPTTANNSNDTGWSACTSPKSYPGLSDGSHLFQVRDGGFPTNFTWIVDATGPAVTFDSAPPAFTGLDQNSADIEFSASNPNGPVTFECRYYDASIAPGPWDPCTSPQSVSWDEMNDGTTMRFQVRSTSSVGNTGAVATTEWTIESTLPTVAIGPDVAGWDGTTNTGGFSTANSDRPAPTTTVTEPQFRMTSSKPFAGANFACDLNGEGAISPCGADGSPGKVVIAEAGPDSLGQATVEGENTLTVWAVGPAGNVSDTPDTYTWTQDTTAPTLSFTSSNPVVTNSNDLHVTFSSDEAVKPVDGFKCRLDGNPGSEDPDTWANCDTMIDPQNGEWVGTTLTKGQHKLDVKGIDVWNNRQVAGNGLRYSFTISRAIPSTMVTAGPDNPTAEDSATFEFAAAPTPSGIAGYECQLDGGGFSACTSPKSYTGLSDASHTFEVRATDNAGNVETPAADYNWTVDSTLPVVTLTDDLPGAVTNQDSVNFGLSVVPGDSTMECRLIGPGQTAGTVAWDSCGATKSYT